MSQQIDENVQRSRVDLFTPEEHRILSEWFGVAPPTEAGACGLDDAFERLGVTEAPHTLYQQSDAAVAFILLEGVEDQLPNCGIVDEEGVTLTRAYRPNHLVPRRKVAIVPQHLFTLNWADSGPGVSWPGAYFATWVPVYDRYVVTYSADTPEVFGYCDLALGHFGQDEELKQGSRRVITGDWSTQHDEFCQRRWAYLFAAGLVDEEEAEAWADAVWPDGCEW